MRTTPLQVFIYVAGAQPITDFLAENAVEMLDGGGVAVSEDGAVVACDAAAVKRFWTSDAAEWRAPAKIAAFASFEATVAVGLTNGEVWLLDAATLAPLRSVAASEVGVASVAFSSDVLVVGDAEGVVVAFDL